MKKRLLGLAKGALGIVSGILYILSLPPVRDFIWNKVLNKGKEKVVDAQAKVVGKEKKKFKLFG
ncbi:hypothetical protein KJ766_00860 [Patescibacteria group bacterium]|nr:hypothetical protein [Patescibacteria group bacterium]